MTYAGPSSTQKDAYLIQISGNDDDGNSITSFVQSFIGNTQSNIKGHVRLSLKGDNSKFLLFIITSVSFSSSNGSYILNVNNVSFSDSNPFSINTDNDLLVSFAMVGTKGEKGDKGVTGADSTVPGPRGPTGADSIVPGPRGPTGADSTDIGPRGPTGADSSVPG